MLTHKNLNKNSLRIFNGQQMERADSLHPVGKHTRVISEPETRLKLIIKTSCKT